MSFNFAEWAPLPIARICTFQSSSSGLPNSRGRAAGEGVDGPAGVDKGEELLLQFGEKPASNSDAYSQPSFVGCRVSCSGPIDAYSRKVDLRRLQPPLGHGKTSQNHRTPVTVGRACKALQEVPITRSTGVSSPAQTQKPPLPVNSQ